MDFYFCVNSVHFSRDPILTSPVSCLLLPFSSFSKRLKSPGCHRQADSSFVHVIAPGILFAGTWALSNLDSLWLDQLRSLLWEIPSPPKVPALMPKPCAPRWTLWGEWNAGEPHSTQSTGLRVEDSDWPPDLGLKHTQKAGHACHCGCHSTLLALPSHVLMVGAPKTPVNACASGEIFFFFKEPYGGVIYVSYNVLIFTVQFNDI